jgi:cytochrome c peroxidase
MRALKGLPLVLLLLIGACAEPETTAPDASSIGPAFANGGDLNPAEQLGKSIYFDENLSFNRNQACASCHVPEWGFTGPSSEVNNAGAVYEGSITGRFGNRKPPSAAYATPSPVLYYDAVEGLFIGGNFWDGRATGERLGNPAAEQALGPFLNPAEQALPDKACVVYRVCASYGTLFEDVWGTGACDINFPGSIDNKCSDEDKPVNLPPGERAKIDAAYDQIGLSVAAFEASSEVNQYSSKYDAYLAGMADLSKAEKKGLNLFMHKAKCALCHILDAGPAGEPPLLTDFTFDNLGVPINPQNPAFIADGFVDPGLGGFLATRPDYASMAAANLGKHKVPTLRNVDLRPNSGEIKAFGHNGYFKSLKGIVHFYNTRDAKPACAGLVTEAEALAANCWPAPEVAANVNTAELGDLKLTPDQEDALVAFLKTLSDGYMR